MSRKSEQARLLGRQNRVAILMALLRRHLAPTDYDRLLQLHAQVWQLFIASGTGGVELQMWMHLTGSVLESALADLHQGMFPGPQVRRLVHLYRDLFLLPAGEDPS